MNNKTEKINGRLLQFFGVWKIQSGYGTFPLAKNLQTKPAPASNGAWCSATVHQGEVTEYHFEAETV